MVVFLQWFGGIAHNAPEALRSVLHFAKPSDVRSPWKGLGRQSLRGDVTEARRDFVTSVKYKRSAGFPGTTVRQHQILRDAKILNFRDTARITLIQCCGYVLFSFCSAF